MFNKLNLWKMAVASDRLQGEIHLRSMPRLAPLLSESDGTVTFTLQGGIDEQGWHYILGQADTCLMLVCQRCMETLQLPLELSFQIGLVRSESQALQLPRRYDPLITEQTSSVVDMIEDELILSLPLAPKHKDIDQCPYYGFSSTQNHATKPTQNYNGSQGNRTALSNLNLNTESN